MSDIMKMDELLGSYQQKLNAAASPVAAPSSVSAIMPRRAIIAIAVLCYGIAAIGMVSYAFWAAAHFGK